MVLAAMVVASSAMAPAGALAGIRLPDRPPEEVRDAVREVLARPEFREPARSPVQRARDWVWEQVARLLGSLVTGDRASFLAWAVLAAGLAVTAFFAVRFARGFTGDPARDVTGGSPPRRTAEDWRGEAEAHESEGRWRMATRCRYRALVAALARRGLLDEVPGRTAGEYRAELGMTLPAAAADFAGATEIFERAWYGNRPTGAAECARLRELADRVTAVAGASAATTAATSAGAGMVAA